MPLDLDGGLLRVRGVDALACSGERLGFLGNGGGHFDLGGGHFCLGPHGQSSRPQRGAALQLGLRPVLFESRDHEVVQDILWGDGHWAALPPGVPF